MINHLLKIILFALSVPVLAGTCFGMSPPSAHAAEAPLKSPDIVSVDRTTFFNEGKYINLENYDNPIDKTDFDVSGGTMIDLEPSGSKYDLERNLSPYAAMQIPYENIQGKTTGIPGYGFVCDKTAAAANGARVSITYDYVGNMKDIADASCDVPVSIRATYTVRDGKTIAEEGDYQLYYNGHPVIHIPLCFSYGAFFCGTDELDTRFEFFNADTGEPLHLGTIFVTATSLNRGEGFALPASQVRTCYLSNEAPSASTIYNALGVKTPYQVIPGSLLYDKSADYDKGYTTFIGCPDVYDDTREKKDFVDTIGDETFYWRSVCFSLDCGTSSVINAKVYAVKTADWSGTPGIPGDQQAKNGSMWFATNFMTLTAARPEAPKKSVDKTSDVRLGDFVTYNVSQQVNDLGADCFIRYESLILSDRLPDALSYRSARLLGPEGDEVTDAGSAHYSEADHTVSFAFSERYLADDMAMEGETYTLEIVTEVTDYPDDGTLTVTNRAKASINGLEQQTQNIDIALVSPELLIEKHADGNLATAVNDFEFQPGDEITYHATLKQIRDKTRAKAITVSDTLPEGLLLVVGSLQVLGADDKHISQDESGWSLRFGALDKGHDVVITYRAVATPAGNGRELVNTASAWAENIAREVIGNEYRPTRNDAEVYANEPILSITEEVAASPTTGDTYEHRVGDGVTYTITLENTAAGTIAKNTVVSHLDFPPGFALADLPDATAFDGLACAGSPHQILYPVHRDDDTHGELETRDLVGRVDRATDGSGASLSLNYLPSHTPVTFSLTFMATEGVNGMEITGNAVASAENATEPVTSEPDTRIWINSPRLSVDKQVPSLAYQVNDIVTYRLDVANDARGTVARNLIIDDCFETPGMELVRNSFVISDASGTIITDRFTIGQNAHEQKWSVETESPLVHPETYHLWNTSHGGALFGGSGQNPLGFDRETAYRIEYQAHITDAALASHEAVNKVIVTSDENLPTHDEETVSIEGPALDVRKAADIGSYRIGDTAEFTVSVTNLRTSTVAHNVSLDDTFAIGMSNTVAIDTDSLQVFDEQMRTLSGWVVTWIDDDAGNHRGFHLDTHSILTNSGKIVVTYRATILSTTPSGTLTNTATARADDTPAATTSCTITCTDTNEDIVSLRKTSERHRYRPGDSAAYTLTLENTDRSIAARNPVISDRLATTENAEIIPGSASITDAEGTSIESAQVIYELNDAGATVGFSLETNGVLPAGESWVVTYRTHIHEEASPGSEVKNIAWARCENAPDVSAEHTVAIEQVPRTEPIIGYKTTAYVNAEVVSGEYIQPGDDLLYHITLRNTGAQPAPHVRVRNYIPTGTSYHAETATDDGVFVRSSGSRDAYIEWVLDDLLPEEVRTISFGVKVSPEAPDFIVNTARYCTTSHIQNAGDVALPDPERTTAKTMHATQTELPADGIVNVVMSSLPAAGVALSPGDTVTYTLVATNQGGSPTQDILIRNVLPPALIYLPGSASKAGEHDEDTGCLEWTIPNLDPGESTELSFRADIRPDFTTGSFENQATFQSATDEALTNDVLFENTSNIVEHTAPMSEQGDLTPRTGDTPSLFGIGILASLGAAACAILALTCAKAAKRSRGSKADSIDLRVYTKPRKRSHDDYIAWK